MQEEGKKRILILCVDRDNDIGVKTGLKTPILGRERNLEAASKLALSDPEESDANAIFGALRAYDSLVKEATEEDYEIATIVGSELGEIKADKQLRDQLLAVLKQFAADSVIFITDGFSDEAVIPIVQSHVPILSIRRVVVKHSARLEENYAVLSRYFTKLVEDPYYSRWILGAPGILLIALAALWYLAPNEVGIVILTIVGILFVIKGFSIDKKVEEWMVPSPPNLIRMFTMMTGLILIGLDGYIAYLDIVKGVGTTELWWANIAQVVGIAMKSGTNLMVLAACIFLIGIAIYFYFMRDSRIWWTIVGIVAALWMREIAMGASDVLLQYTQILTGLIITIILGIVSTVITIFITLNISKRFEHYFHDYEAAKDEES